MGGSPFNHDMSVDAASFVYKKPVRNLEWHKRSNQLTQAELGLATLKPDIFKLYCNIMLITTHTHTNKL